MLSGIKLVDRADAERLAREERRQHKDKKKEQKKQQKKVCGRPQGQRWATEAVPAAAAVCVSPPASQEHPAPFSLPLANGCVCLFVC